MCLNNRFVRLLYIIDSIVYIIQIYIYNTIYFDILYNNIFIIKYM